MSALFKALAVVALSFLAGMGGDASLPTAAFSVSASSPSVNTPVQFQDQVRAATCRPLHRAGLHADLQQSRPVRAKD